MWGDQHEIQMSFDLKSILVLNADFNLSDMRDVQLVKDGGDTILKPVSPVQRKQLRQAGVLLFGIKAIQDSLSRTGQISSDVAHADVFRSVSKSLCACACGALCETFPDEFKQFISTIFHIKFLKKEEPTYDRTTLHLFEIVVKDYAASAYFHQSFCWGFHLNPAALSSSFFSNVLPVATTHILPSSACTFL